MFADHRFAFLDHVRFSLGFITTPIHWVVDVPMRLSLWVDDVVISRTDLLDENQRLREELLVARQELQLLESLASENSRLLELSEATQLIDGKVTLAEIINVSPDPYSKRVLINKGALNGVRSGQPVLDDRGLMGQVDEVEPFTSWVLLITDSHHVTPVQVNRNGERALARGSRGTGYELDLEFVTQSQDMLAGDLLVSSGMGQVYPKNYPVARITSVYADPGQNFMTVKARPLAEMANTRHVMLVARDDTGPRPAEGAESVDFRFEAGVNPADTAGEEANPDDGQPAAGVNPADTAGEEANPDDGQPAAGVNPADTAGDGANPDDGQPAAGVNPADTTEDGANPDDGVSEEERNPAELIEDSTADAQALS